LNDRDRSHINSGIPVYWSFFDGHLLLEERQYSVRQFALHDAALAVYGRCSAWSLDQVYSRTYQTGKRTMSRILQPDDFELGMKMTVHTGPMRESNTGSFFGLVAIKGREDTSFKGEIIEIVALLLPYIAVKHHSKWKNDNGRITKLDTRGRKFMSVTPEYEQAILAPDK
jgi:hypothetical protein